MFLNDISPSLRMKIKKEIFIEALKTNEMLIHLGTDNPKHLKMLGYMVERLEIALVEPENQIVKQGSEDIDKLYFVQKGECNVNVMDKIGLENGLKRVRSLFPGDHFGVSIYLI